MVVENQEGLQVLNGNMTPSEIITFIISSIGGSAVLFGVVAWLARSLIKNFIDRDLEKFKSNLEKMSYEHQVRFSKLHEIRAETIAKLYSLLYDYQWAVCAFLREFPKNIDTAELDKKSYEFKDYYDKNRILFTENMCTQVEKLVDLLYSSYVPLETSNNADGKQSTEWRKCADTIQKEYPKVRQSLEREFKEILGVIEK